MGGIPLNASKARTLDDFIAYIKGCDAHVQGRAFNWKKNYRAVS